MSDKLDEAIAAVSPATQPQRLEGRISLVNNREAVLNVPIPMNPDDFARLTMTLVNILTNNVDSPQPAKAVILTPQGPVRVR